MIKARVVIIMDMGTVMYMHNHMSTNVFGHRGVGTIIYGHSHVYAQICLVQGCGHNHIWAQSCICTDLSGHRGVGTIIYGHSHVYAQICLVTGVWAQARMAQTSGLHRQHLYVIQLQLIILGILFFFYLHKNFNLILIFHNLHMFKAVENTNYTITYIHPQ